MCQKIEHPLASLRALMKSHLVDAIYIPSSDPHQNEYLPDHWKIREWISGFTGSSGLVIITQHFAGLWTDSRYYIQAKDELSEEWTLMRMGDKATPSPVEWCQTTLAKGARLAIDYEMISVALYDQLTDLLSISLIQLISIPFDWAECYIDRPPLPNNPIYIHPLAYSCQSTTSKQSRIVAEMEAQGIDWLLVTRLDDIAWTLNLRGSDIAFNPSFISLLLIGKNKMILGLLDRPINKELNFYLSENKVELCAYESFDSLTSQIVGNDCLGTAAQDCSKNLIDRITAVNLKHIKNPIPLLKAIKSSQQIAHLEQTMIKDACALAHAFYWLQKALSSNKTITEYDFGEKIQSERRKQADYVGESFSPIVGYGANGAIVHYRASPEKSAKIQPEGILLCDSGGQYLSGTTDITRTIALSSDIRDIIKHDFTLVLKGHIALATTEFPEGTTGAQLDMLARQYLWAEGKNYGHGTGHGVGFFNNVHEGPPSYSPKSQTALEIGMLSSNEPGYYVEGQYGIRIENLITVESSDHRGFLRHRTLSLYPLDRHLIKLSLLTLTEIKWINDYHSLVCDKVSPHLNGELKTWFIEQCKEI